MTLSYHSFLNKILDLYGQGQLKEALKYIKKNRDRVNGIDSQIDNFAFCIAAVDGNAELALDIFEKAIREKGFWFETAQLEEDSDLDIIRDDVTFKGLLEMNRRREHEFLGLGKASVHVRDGKHDKGYIILHGNHENARVTKGIWTEEAVDHSLSAFLQSGQHDFYDAYHWNNREKSVNDSQKLIKELMHEYKDVKNWTLVGFSMGATVALDLVTRGLVMPDQLILFGPWLPYLKDENEILAGIGPDMKFSILIGDGDETCMEHAKIVVSTLAEYGKKVEYIVMNQTGHGYPEDLKMYLDQL